MGMDARERFNGIAETLYKISHYLEWYVSPAGDRDMRMLLEHIDRLWPAFLAGQTYISHDLSEAYIKDASLVGAIFSAQRSEWNDRAALDDPYWRMHELLDIAHLVNEDTGRILIEIFDLSDTLASYLRGDPEFTSRYAELNQEIGRLQGFCYTQFRENSFLFKAWLIRNLCLRKILSPKRPLDAVTKWWANTWFVHHVRLRHELGVRELYAIYNRIQFVDLTVQQKVVLSLRLAGRRFHYEHEHKRALSYWEQHNSTAAEEDRIDLDRLRTALARCTEEYRLSREDDKELYAPFCNLTFNSAGRR